MEKHTITFITDLGLFRVIDCRDAKQAKAIIKDQGYDYNWISIAKPEEMDKHGMITEFLAYNLYY